MNQQTKTSARNKQMQHMSSCYLTENPINISPLPKSPMSCNEFTKPVISVELQKTGIGILDIVASKDIFLPHGSLSKVR